MAAQIRKLTAAFALLSSGVEASSVDVVLAHYNEDLSWLSKIGEDSHIHVYTKGPQVELNFPSGSQTSLQQLPNVGRESHTYLSHIVKNYERLADWTVFTQAGEPSFGYKGHRSGGGHLLSGDDFANYLRPHPSGSRFVYTSAVHLPSMNHLLRASYCIKDELLEGGGVDVCPKEAAQWTPWWDIGDFHKYIASKVEGQHGEEIMDFYRKYIDPTYKADELVAFFPQGARFAVSKDTILRRPKAQYAELLNVLSKDTDSYAGYYMEWLWSELFLGHQEPCSVPAKVAPVSHAEAMERLSQRFPRSVERQIGVAAFVAGKRSLTSLIRSARRLATISGDISGGISGGGNGGDESTTTTSTTERVELSGTMQLKLMLVSLVVAIVPVL
jgi:hypothetical protein